MMNNEGPAHAENAAAMNAKSTTAKNFKDMAPRVTLKPRRVPLPKRSKTRGPLKPTATYNKLHPMKFETPLRLASALIFLGAITRADVITSPDSKLSVDFHLNENGAPRYSIKLGNEIVLRESKLGVIRDDVDFSQSLTLTGPIEISKIEDKYEILTAKRKQNLYSANRALIHLQSPDGAKMDLLIQVSNDGVGFRYGFPGKGTTVHKIKDELSSFHFPADTKAWLQPMSPAKTGWAETNPSYEEYHEKEINVGTPSPLGAGWVYPALFRSGETWMLVSESAPSRHYCATRLKSDSPDGEYSVGFPDAREVFPGGSSAPESTLPWVTPWRVIVIGSLKTVTESMLGIDLAEKPAANAITPEPGKASWSWPLMGDGNTKFAVQKEFIDYAAKMGWRYTLIDALWDKQIGDAQIKELVDYAKTKNVKILVWYNSAGSWNKAPQTPRDNLLTKASRKAEFERMKNLGVAGLKIDFFGGDGQSMIAYQQDLLEETAPYGLSINFHGTTLPRGWQRTYPHFMTAEAIRGLEFVTFEQANADRQPTHCAMIPFTRNVFDPMDFTPVVLDKINNKIKRKTTSAFELALSVLFTSGIQHYGEIPAGIAKAPASVQEFLKEVPSIWEDSKFISGYPGKYIVMARKGGGKWYVAGINSETSSKKLTLDLSGLGATTGNLITDGAGGNLSFEEKKINLAVDRLLEVNLQPSGGFVLTLED
jgi:alpha-glucosidase